MPRTRLELHEQLCDILGSRNVYFQPPSSIKMKYQAIRYSRYNIENMNANNSVYIQPIYYQITVIDFNRDSEIVSKLSMLPNCRYDRHFTSDDLNHDVFILHI